MPVLTINRVEIPVNYGQTLTEAIAGNGFTPFRMEQLKRSKRDFAPRSSGTRKLWAHHGHLPGITDPSVALAMMQEGVSDARLRLPQDIREPLALGRFAVGFDEIAFAIPAPDLVDEGVPNLILKLERFPEWMGLFPNTWDPEFDDAAEFMFVAFSDSVGR